MVVQRVGKYSILESLGEGSLGAVYRAYDGDLARPVAVRIMSDGIRWDAALRSRLSREFQSIAGLQHPNIAELYELGEDGNITFLAMELLEGTDLRSLINGKSELSVETKLTIIKQTAEGLGHAHEKGVLHRDIKPSNIFATPGGVRIVDFGIAHLIARCLIRPAVRWGAPIYLSPEQIQGKECDQRSEVFTAGIVFYELLTSVHPFNNGNSNKVLDDIVSASFPAAHEQCPNAPPGLWAFLERCLAKDPADRFAGMEDVAAECDEILEDISRECQSMAVELQMSVSRIKRAIARPGAPAGLQQLLQSIQHLLGSDRKRNYESLDRLMGEVAEQSEIIHSLLKGKTPPAVPYRESASVEVPERESGLQLHTDSYGPEAPSANPVDEKRALSEPDPTLIEGSDPVESCEASEAPTVTAEDPALSALGGLHRAEVAFLQDMYAEAPEDRVEATPEHFVHSPEPELPGDDWQRSDGAAEPAAGLPPADLSHVSVMEPAHHRRPLRLPLWTAGLVALVALFLVGVWVDGRFGLVARATSRWENPAQWVSAGAPRQSTGKAAVREPVAPKGIPQSAATPVDLLFTEAQGLAKQGRFDESRVFIRRVLEIQPDHEPAKTLLDELDQPEASPGANPDKALRLRLVRIGELIEAGQLRRAKLELDKLRALRPNPPELAALRKKWEKRGTELQREQERVKQEQAEVLRKQRAREGWSRRAGELLKQGKYAEAELVVNQWLHDDPQGAPPAALRAQLADMQHSLQGFEEAIGSRKYADAAAALARVESINPSDPGIPDLRRRLSAKLTAARAAVSIFRLAEPGTPMIDGVSLGTDGEVENAAVSIGERVISVKRANGSVLRLAHDFADGQKVAFVYDTVLRAMTESDRELLSLRREREQVHRFEVEHSHGLFRGSCRGELRISGLEVEYKAENKSHSFEIPFSKLRLKGSARDIELRFASDNAPFQEFKARTAGEADALRKTWTQVSKLR
jgi:serine/threonine-protein kinase